jgi:hypothetical protein
MEWSSVFEKGVTMALTTMLNWKAPQRDKRANFWLNQLPVIHSYLATLFSTH